ncbi:hypothetical protein BDV96DRAFT_633969 [Lophiotrema nucula]|uniref:2EXR domain-containing protein n=1 Tax=Lophiotrema nucula TaxID=690887 RepID=A0A6A5YZX9_9PLEO|nr:hypothetical protein BDV96DRAFT_633969 [Lophiotrema nucula]
MSTLTSFHRFPNLPIELQLMIWEAVEPVPDVLTLDMSQIGKHDQDSPSLEFCTHVVIQERRHGRFLECFKPGNQVVNVHIGFDWDNAPRWDLYRFPILVDSRTVLELRIEYKELEQKKTRVMHSMLQAAGHVRRNIHHLHIVCENYHGFLRKQPPRSVGAYQPYLLEAENCDLSRGGCLDNWNSKIKFITESNKSVCEIQAAGLTWQTVKQSEKSPDMEIPSIHFTARKIDRPQEWPSDQTARIESFSRSSELRLMVWESAAREAASSVPDVLTLDLVRTPESETYPWKIQWRPAFSIVLACRESRAVSLRSSQSLEHYEYGATVGCQNSSNRSCNHQSCTRFPVLFDPQRTVLELRIQVNSDEEWMPMYEPTIFCVVGPIFRKAQHIHIHFGESTRKKLEWRHKVTGGRENYLFSSNEWRLQPTTSNGSPSIKQAYTSLLGRCVGLWMSAIYLRTTTFTLASSDTSAPRQRSKHSGDLRVSLKHQ